MAAPGTIVEILKGEHSNKKAMVKDSDGYHYHLQLLTPSGNLSKTFVSYVHKFHVRPVKDGNS